MLLFSLRTKRKQHTRRSRKKQLLVICTCRVLVDILGQMIDAGLRVSLGDNHLKHCSSLCIVCSANLEVADYQAKSISSQYTHFALQG